MKIQGSHHPFAPSADAHKTKHRKIAQTIQNEVKKLHEYPTCKFRQIYV